MPQSRDGPECFLTEQYLARDLLLEGVDQLPEPERQCAKRLLESASVREIADELGIDHESAIEHCQQAIVRLRSLLKVECQT